MLHQNPGWSTLGGMAVVKLVSKDNLFAPDFYGDQRTGHASWLMGFICPDSYSLTFDIMGGCCVCCSEQKVFLSNLAGTLVVGDAYMSSDIGGKRKCVPVFRQHNAGFQKITSYSLWFLLRYRKKHGGKPVGCPDKPSYVSYEITFSVSYQ